MQNHVAWLSLSMLYGLTGCTERTPSAAAVVDTAASADAGERIYSGSCAACHQQDARGVQGVYPSLTGSPVVLGAPAELARWVVRGVRPATMPAGRYRTVMPQFGWLKNQDAALLLTFIRSHFGNSAPPVTAAVVAEALQ